MGVGKSVPAEDEKYNQLYRDIANHTTAKSSSTPARYIDYRARVLKRLDCDKLWQNFLESSSGSFILTKAEAILLLKKSLKVGT